MKLRVADLAKVIQIALTEIEKTQGPEVELPNELYWCVADGSLFDVEREPKEHTIGSLVDDVDELGNELRTDDPTASHILRHASGVLRALALRR